MSLAPPSAASKAGISPCQIRGRYGSECVWHFDGFHIPADWIHLACPQLQRAPGCLLAQASRLTPRILPLHLDILGRDVPSTLTSSCDSSAGRLIPSTKTLTRRFFIYSPLAQSTPSSTASTCDRLTDGPLHCSPFPIELFPNTSPWESCVLSHPHNPVSASTFRPWAECAQLPTNPLHVTRSTLPKSVQF